MKPKEETFSFDVFDTCLCRLCGDWENAIAIIAGRIAAAAGHGDEAHALSTIAHLRRLADGVGTLHESYLYIKDRLPSLPLTAEEMEALEMACERDLLSPIAATLELVNVCRQKGRILFISDMHLPASFIAERLREHGFMRDGDRIYVSCEHHASKYDGELYHIVSRQEGISFRHWHHYGDNPYSDVKVPHRLGIDAHRLRYPDHDAIISLAKPPAGLPWPGIVKGISRAVALRSTDAPAQRAYVCDITAPVLCSWVAKTMADAERRGIRRLYFCARDSHSAYHIAQRLHSVYPSVESRYLFISRQSLDTDPALLLAYLEQEGLAHQTEASGLVDILSRGITTEKINRLLTANNYPPLRHSYTLNQSIEEPFAMPHDTTVENCNYGGNIRIDEAVNTVKFHSRVIGYRQSGGTIRPVFNPKDADEEEHLGHPDLRATSRRNNAILKEYADALVTTGMHHYAAQILHQLALPNQRQFYTHPSGKHREHLRYLSDFTFNGSWFIGRSLTLMKWYLWTDGSMAYTFPWMGERQRAHTLKWLLLTKRTLKKLRLGAAMRKIRSALIQKQQP